jgi:hypothetical protein|nr:MAG TPA: hypothetical protein [Caudoviricetes sp.]
MAEIKWSNVDGSALNGAVSNANSGVNNYVRTLFGIGSNVEDFTDKLQKRSDETAKWNRNQNTQQIISKMHDADSLNAMNQLQAQGIGNAQNALNQFGGQVDLAALNEAKATWATDTEKRASAKDSLLDYSPEQKALMSEIQNDILTGNVEGAQAKLNSSNFSNKQKSDLVNSVYKAQENNKDFNLKYADTAGKFANSQLEFQKAQAEAQKYENDFYANNGKTEVSKALLSKDPTYLKLLGNIEALGQTTNLLQSQLDMYGSSKILNGGQYAPKLPTDIAPSIGSGSVEPTASVQPTQEAVSAQQALNQEVPNSVTSVAERAAQIATNPKAQSNKPKTEEEFKGTLADAGFTERTGSTIPPALQPTYNKLINGDIDINSADGKKNLALLEAHLNDSIKAYNKQTGSNIQPVTLPTTQVGLADWKRKMASRKEALNQEHQVALNDIFGIKHTNNPNDIDPVRNILKYALTDSEYSKDDAKYQTKDDVIEALKQDKYAKQGWFDGNDLQERAVKLLDRFEPKEVMRIINSVTSNGTREANGILNPFENDEYGAIDDLIRNVDKDPSLLQELRHQVEDVKKVNDNKVSGLDMIIPIGQAASVDASDRNAYGKEYVESKHAINRKVDSEVKAKQAVEDLKQKADIAKTNTAINDAAERFPADTLKALLEEGTLDTATQIKAYVALGNKVPTDLDEKELDKIRNTLLELPAEKLKTLIQSKVNTATLKKEADRLRKELKDKDLLTSDLESKLKSIN